MLNRNIKSGFFYNALFTGINLLFPFISFQYVLHILGPDGIGKAQFAFSFAQYFTIIAAIGIPVYGVREVARCKDGGDKLSKLFSELLIINSISSLFLSLIYIGIIITVPYFTADRWLYISGVLLILFSSASIEWLYTGLSNFKPLAVRNIAIKSVSLALIFVLINTRADYFNYFLLNIGGLTAGNFINIWLIRKQVKFKLRGLDLKQHIKPLLLVFGVSIGSSMYTVLDTVLLGFLTDATSVGLYTCAVKFAKMFMPVLGIIGTVLMPEISKHITKDDLRPGQHLLDKSFQFIVFFSVPVSAGFFILSPEFIFIFSGKEFANAIITMQILSALPVLLGLGYFFASQILLPAGHYRAVLIAVLIGLTLFVVLNFAMVPTLQHNGAAWANIVSETVVTLTYIYFVKRYYALNINIKAVLTATLSCILFLPAVYLVRKLHLPVGTTFITATAGCCTLYILSQWLIFNNQIIDNLIVFITRGTKQGIEKLYN